ncbi:MAG: hypothetical protein EBX52_12675, partial [Proteobacteria bacterium]|nr:hypothetical protein [Pseudomonadota bacterium]
MKSFITRNRSIVTLALVAAFTLSSSLHAPPAFAQGPDQGLKSTIAFLDKANSSTDKKQVLSQIRSLKGQAFDEVYDLVKKQIVLDSHAASLDADRMIAWVEVLTSISGKGETRFLNWLTREINANFRTHPDLKTIRTALKSSIETLKGKPEVVARSSIRRAELEAALALSRPVNQGVSDELLKTFSTAYQGEKFELLRAATERVLTQELRNKQLNHTLKPVIARETEINSAIDVLLRMKGKAPLILGD